MKILAVDNECAALRILCRAIESAVPDAEVRSCLRVDETLTELRENGFQPDVAFLDIEMPGMTGLELAKTIKIMYPAANIVFVTGFSEYAMEAMAQRPSGYVMKPATREKILAELQNLRTPPPRISQPKAIRVQCFGAFEVFVNGEPIAFRSPKAKELLAYLVDRRGAGCTAAELSEVLWDDGVYDRARQKQMAALRGELFKQLKSCRAAQMLIRFHNSLAIDRETFDCDYYMALEGDSVAINCFQGEYLLPYCWAECTASGLAVKYGGQLEHKKRFSLFR